jgi:hypothetical protein
VVESYVFIGRTIGVNCEIMMEFVSNMKRQTHEKGFALFKNDITTIFYRYDTCVL